MTAIETLTSKIGTYKGHAGQRVWIEGDRLLRAGFAPGVRYSRLYSAPGEPATITLTMWGTADHPYKVSGKGAKPVIDVTGKAVARKFEGHSHVTVAYYPGRIVITGA